MSFDLNDCIRRNLTQSDSADPYDVAQAVASEVPSQQVRAVMASLLPDAVREVIRTQRNAPPSTGANGKRGLGEMTSDPHRMREFVPGVGWKFKADLTAEDCDAIADEYLSRARANEAKAAEFRELAARLRKQGGTLRDLGLEDAA